MNEIAIIVSEFNADITEALLKNTVDRLQELAFTAQHMTIVRVPGAIEIPFTAQLLAKKKKYAAIICIGAVIRGETDHYDYVCQQVSMGCQRMMLDYEVPIIFGVLTTHTYQQAEERVDGTVCNKGREIADATFTMLNVVKAHGLG